MSGDLSGWELGTKPQPSWAWAAWAAHVMEGSTAVSSVEKAPKFCRASEFKIEHWQ